MFQLYISYPPKKKKNPGCVHLFEYEKKHMDLMSIDVRNVVSNPQLHQLLDRT